ncbi:MAG: L-threonylcarbamoyladenylate synthase [Ornithinimicrobium sp.]
MILDCTQGESRDEAVKQAIRVVQSGKLIVLPTDTVYGIGADAFDKVAVAMVLAAKHRSRDMPPPVLVPGPRTVDGLATDVPMYAQMLMRAFWPGPLTLVMKAQRSLAWDLGKTNGTVALRMPDDELALAVLEGVGPMAVTSANLTGQPAATTALEAQDQLRGAVECYLDGGPREEQSASTIVDCTGTEPVVLRHGSLSADLLREVLGDTRLHNEPPPVLPAFRARRKGPTFEAAHAVGSVRPSGLTARTDTLRNVAARDGRGGVSTPTVGGAIGNPETA